MRHTTEMSAGLLPLLLILGLVSPAAARAQGSELPNCTGWSNCNTGRAVCRFEANPPYIGPITIADDLRGLSSDGRGPYLPGGNGVRYSMVVQGHMGLQFRDGARQGDRAFTANLDNPVPGGGGIPLGTITVNGDNSLYAAWRREGNLHKSLLSIPIGETVPAEQLNVSLHINGRFHVLQMGPGAYGQCHSGQDTTTVHGRGTSAATIHRTTRTTWVVDLPTHSVGRLFDVSHTIHHAQDKGLYYFQLHFEISAKPGAVVVLRAVAESAGGAAVVARYRELKRDSSDTYSFGASQLTPAGFWLLDNKRPREALPVFRLGVEEDPESSSAHEGLGESYLAIGDTSKAVASYGRALELDPKNRQVADVLRRLGLRP